MQNKNFDGDARLCLFITVSMESSVVAIQNFTEHLGHVQNFSNIRDKVRSEYGIKDTR